MRMYTNDGLPNIDAIQQVPGHFDILFHLTVCFLRC